MYDEYVSRRAFFLFFFASPSAGGGAVFLAAVLALVVLAGAFEAVADWEAAGALEAVEAGLGAIECVVV